MSEQVTVLKGQYCDKQKKFTSAGILSCILFKPLVKPKYKKEL